jgi:hypothetical protein
MRTKVNNMLLLEFTAPNTGWPICIPVSAITGFTPSSSSHGKTFIATGADAADGGENGWYVQETYDEVKDKLAGVFVK